MVPTVPVACQPAVRDIVGRSPRTSGPQTSAPMMKAARISDGEDFAVSGDRQDGGNERR